jgi:ribosomal protein L12E/L44/L45/RPP1/RPP2
MKMLRALALSVVGLSVAVAAPGCAERPGKKKEDSKDNKKKDDAKKDEKKKE